MVKCKNGHFLPTFEEGRGGWSGGSTLDCSQGGRGFDSRWKLFFFYQKCVLNQVPHGGATLLNFLNKVLICAARGETSLIC